MGSKRSVAVRILGGICLLFSGSVVIFSFKAYWNIFFLKLTGAGLIVFIKALKYPLSYLVCFVYFIAAFGLLFFKGWARKCLLVFSPGMLYVAPLLIPPVPYLDLTLGDRGFFGRAHYAVWQLILIFVFWAVSVISLVYLNRENVKAQF